MAASPPINPATARVLSHFGVRPSRRSGAPHFHAGLDLSTVRGRGEPIFAAEDGTVLLVGQNANPGSLGGYGNCIVLRHAGGIYTMYAHLDQALVVPGQSVGAGQMIGRMGNSTNGQFSPMPGQDPAEWRRQAQAHGYRSPPMAPHLHFEVRSRSDAAPWPGPYPQSQSQAGYDIDPAVWLRSKGIVFTSRGGVAIQPGSEAAASQATWGPMIQHADSMAGLGVLDSSGGKDAGSTIASATSLYASPIEPGKLVVDGYEPVTFERDVYVGFTPIEWGMVGLGTVVFAGGAAYYVIKQRSPATANRRRRKRARS